VSAWSDTLRALAEPRRAVPVGIVVLAMVGAQWWFSRTLAATLVGAAMAAGFVFVVPAAWRILFPPGTRLSVGRLALYAFIGALPALFGWSLPRVAGLGASFLTVGVNSLVIAALSWAGGWGLARDIDQEASLSAARQRVEQLARQAEQAELLALRAHLDPHFLFNTLNAIAEWTREDAEVAEAAILQLSALLREVMAGVRAPAWPLSRELSVARAVWELHGIRDPERYRFEWQVPDPPPVAEVPPLVLLPVVENAVKHGPAAGHPGVLSLSVDPGPPLRVEVRNPGPFSGPRDGGEGLALVRRRLALSGDGSADFSISARDGDTVATLILPGGPPCAS